MSTQRRPNLSAPKGNSPVADNRSETQQSLRGLFDEDPRHQKEFKRFEQELFSVLVSFEQAKEWADLSNVLSRLHRVFTTVPDHIRPLLKTSTGANTEELVALVEAFFQRRLAKSNMKRKLGRRLAQCLNPQLPSGVHFNTLKIYDSIFTQIGGDGVVADLGLYSSGLFPNVANVGKQVKYAMLVLLEKHYLPLKARLEPCITGLVTALLPCIEDETDSNCARVMDLLKKLCDAVGTKLFCSVLWLLLLKTPKIRGPGIKLLRTIISDEVARATKALAARALPSTIPDTELSGIADSDGVGTGTQLPTASSDNPRNPKKKDAPSANADNLSESQIDALFPDRSILMMKTLEALLDDPSQLVKRAALDFMCAYLPISSRVWPTEQHKIEILKRMLELLKMNEGSLNRRIVVFLTNRQDDFGGLDAASRQYFETWAHRPLEQVFLKSLTVPLCLQGETQLLEDLQYSSKISPIEERFADASPVTSTVSNPNIDSGRLQAQQTTAVAEIARESPKTIVVTGADSCMRIMAYLLQEVEEIRDYLVNSLTVPVLMYLDRLRLQVEANGRGLGYNQTRRIDRAECNEIIMDILRQANSDSSSKQPPARGQTAALTELGVTSQTVGGANAAASACQIDIQRDEYRKILEQGKDFFDFPREDEDRVFAILYRLWESRINSPNQCGTALYVLYLHRVYIEEVCEKSDLKNIEQLLMLSLSTLPKIPQMVDMHEATRFCMNLLEERSKESNRKDLKKDTSASQQVAETSNRQPEAVVNDFLENFQLRVEETVADGFNHSEAAYQSYDALSNLFVQLHRGYRTQDTVKYEVLPPYIVTIIKSSIGPCAAAALNLEADQRPPKPRIGIESNAFACPDQTGALRFACRGIRTFLDLLSTAQQQVIKQSQAGNSAEGQLTLYQGLRAHCDDIILHLWQMLNMSTLDLDVAVAELLIDLNRIVFVEQTEKNLQSLMSSEEMLQSYEGGCYVPSVIISQYFQKANIDGLIRYACFWRNGISLLGQSLRGACKSAIQNNRASTLFRSDIQDVDSCHPRYSIYLFSDLTKIAMSCLDAKEPNLRHISQSWTIEAVPMLSYLLDPLFEDLLSLLTLMVTDPEKLRSDSAFFYSNLRKIVGRNKRPGAAAEDDSDSFDGVSALLKILKQILHVFECFTSILQIDTHLLFEQMQRHAPTTHLLRELEKYYRAVSDFSAKERQKEQAGGVSTEQAKGSARESSSKQAFSSAPQTRSVETISDYADFITHVSLCFLELPVMKGIEDSWQKEISQNILNNSASLESLNPSASPDIPVLVSSTSPDTNISSKKEASDKRYCSSQVGEVLNAIRAISCNFLKRFLNPISNNPSKGEKICWILIDPMLNVMNNCIRSHDFSIQVHLLGIMRVMVVMSQKFNGCTVTYLKAEVREALAGSGFSTPRAGTRAIQEPTSVRGGSSPAETPGNARKQLAPSASGPSQVIKLGNLACYRGLLPCLLRAIEQMQQASLRSHPSNAIRSDASSATLQRYQQATTISHFVEFIVFITRQIPADTATDAFTHVVEEGIGRFCSEITRSLAAATQTSSSGDVFRERRLEQAELVTLHFLKGIADIVDDCINKCSRRRKETKGGFLGLTSKVEHIEDSTSQSVRIMLFRVIPVILRVSMGSIAALLGDEAGAVSEKNIQPLSWAESSFHVSSTKETIRRHMGGILSTIFKKYPQTFIESVLHICTRISEDSSKNKEKKDNIFTTKSVLETVVALDDATPELVLEQVENVVIKKMNDKSKVAIRESVVLDFLHSYIQHVDRHAGSSSSRVKKIDLPILWKHVAGIIQVVSLSSKQPMTYLWSLSLVQLADNITRNYVKQARKAAGTQGLSSSKSESALNLRSLMGTSTRREVQQFIKFQLQDHIDVRQFKNDIVRITGAVVGLIGSWSDDRTFTNELRIEEKDVDMNMPIPPHLAATTQYDLATHESVSPNADAPTSEDPIRVYKDMIRSDQSKTGSTPALCSVYVLRYLSVFLRTLGSEHNLTAKKDSGSEEPDEDNSSEDRKTFFATSFIESLFYSKYPSLISSHFTGELRANRKKKQSGSNQQAFFQAEWRYLLLCSVVHLPFAGFRTEIMYSLKTTLLNVINDPKFIDTNLMDQRSLACWKILIQELIKEFKGKAGTSEVLFEICWPYTTSMLTTPQKESENKLGFLKRLSLVLYSAEQDAFAAELRSVIDRLSECLQTKILGTQLRIEVLHCFRVLLLRMSPHLLTPCWPLILAELIGVLSSIGCKTAILTSVNTVKTFTPTQGNGNTNGDAVPEKTLSLKLESNLDTDLVLAALKLIDMAGLLDLEEFTLHQWMFQSTIHEPDGGSCASHQRSAGSSPTDPRSTNVALLSARSSGILQEKRFRPFSMTLKRLFEKRLENIGFKVPTNDSYRLAFVPRKVSSAVRMTKTTGTGASATTTSWRVVDVQLQPRSQSGAVTFPCVTRQMHLYEACQILNDTSIQTILARQSIDHDTRLDIVAKDFLQTDTVRPVFDVSKYIAGAQ